MIKPLDVVALVRDEPELGLAAGAEGTVLEAFGGTRPEFEVEFSDDEGETLAVGTLAEDQLRKVWDAPESE